MGGANKKKTFQLVLIKPTHYDDDGYPITWLRSHIPSNTLAALYGLGEDCRQRQVLGPDVDIVIKPFDETNIRVRTDRIIADFKRGGGKGLICLVGVQSNQFPHAVDLARKFLTAGLPVAMGGFHAAGCLSMLPVVPPEIQEAMDMGISIYAGEAEEGRLDEVLRDAWNGTLKRLYNYMDDLPGIENAPTPHLPPAALARNEGKKSSFDLGRGCPFQCSFCTIINVQGRKSRFRNADDLEAIIRENYKQGITSFFITDDNMARNRHWEEFFDRIIELKENEGIQVSLLIQVDTQCHRIPRFIAQGAVGRRLSLLHRAGEHQPGQPAGRQEAPEQDHRIPQDAAGLAQGRHLDLGGLHPRLPGRHARIDPARHGDHQEGAAARHPRAVHADAAARLGGPPDAVEAGRVDGPRPQQVRSPPSRRAPSEDERRGVLPDLSRLLAGLLHARAHRDGGAPPWLDQGPQSRRAGPVHDHVQDHVRGRGHPSAGRRRHAHEVPPRPPLRHADRAGRRVPLEARASRP